MTRQEIANLEHASRAAIAWIPEDYAGHTHYGAVLAALIPALGILAVATTLLVTIL